MRSSLPESPLNPLPPVIWLLTVPVIASEAVFALGGAGLIGVTGQGDRDHMLGRVPSVEMIVAGIVRIVR